MIDKKDTKARTSETLLYYDAGEAISNWCDANRLLVRIWSPHPAPARITPATTIASLEKTKHYVTVRRTLAQN